MQSTTRRDRDPQRSDGAARAKARPVSWRNAFLRAPYIRDALGRASGMISETFETACTWDRFEALHDERRPPQCSTPRRRRARGRRVVTCRFTHVYPDGPRAVLHGARARATHGEQLAQWDAIKAAADDGCSADRGGTITHHHAVGRDHRPGYDRQRPEPVRGRAASRRRRPSTPPASSTPAC